MFPLRNLRKGAGLRSGPNPRVVKNSPLLLTRRSGILLCICRESRACRHSEGKDNATDRNQAE